MLGATVRDSLVAQLRGVADRAARAIAQHDDIVALCLLGSVARGDAGDGSDIDLLVIAEAELRPSELMQRLPRDLRGSPISLLCYSRERWSQEADRGALFVRHVGLEGEPLHDPHRVLRRSLATGLAREPDVEGELRRHVGQLRLYRDPSRLNDQHLFALSHLYALGKAVAIARCAQVGPPVFIKHQALRRLAAARPALAGDVEAINRLRPFYDLTHGRQVPEFPFEPVGAESEVSRAVAAVERLANG